MSVGIEPVAVLPESGVVRSLEEYEERRWHRLAALAVLMETSGTSRGLPDDHYVRAFARINPSSEDIPTTIGAASSFTDLGYEARFIGPIAPEISEEATAWSRYALSTRRGSDFRDRAPGRRLVRALLNETASPWHLLMELPDEDKTELSPVVVLGQTARKVTLYDPAKAESGEPTEHAIWMGRLLGAAAINPRTSLLAVRRR